MLEAIPWILEIRSLLSLIDFDEDHPLLEDFDENLLLLGVDLLLLLLDELVEQMTDL